MASQATSPAPGLRRLLPWEVAGRLDQVAPERVTAPDGRRLRVDYADPAVRSFMDLDVLIRAHDIGRAVEALAAAGFRRTLAEPRPGFDRRFDKGMTLIGPARYELDLHRTVKLRLPKWDNNPANLHAANWRGSCTGRGDRNPLCSFDMTRADEYRKRAAAAEASAQAMSLSEHRRDMLELAALWRELAEEEPRQPLSPWCPDESHASTR